MTRLSHGIDLALGTIPIRFIIIVIFDVIECSFHINIYVLKVHFDFYRPLWILYCYYYNCLIVYKPFVFQYIYYDRFKCCKFCLFEVMKQNFENTQRRAGNLDENSKNLKGQKWTLLQAELKQKTSS